jgi:hypothetical protein
MSQYDNRGFGHIFPRPEKDIRLVYPRALYHQNPCGENFLKDFLSCWGQKIERWGIQSTTPLPCEATLFENPSNPYALLRTKPPLKIEFGNAFCYVMLRGNGSWQNANILYTIHCLPVK